MKLVRAAFLVCATTGAAAVAASPVHVSVRWADPASTPPFHGQVVARPVAYTGQNRPERVVDCDRGEGAADLPPGLWTFEATVKGFWAAPQELLVPNESGVTAEVVLRLWRAGLLKGSASGPSPHEIEVDFRSSPASGAAPEPGRTSCTVAGAAFRCSVPAGRLDVELQATGHVPHYL